MLFKLIFLLLFHQPASASSLRRHIAASLMQHRAIERNDHALQPLSPASYGSSMEVSIKLDLSHEPPPSFSFLMGNTFRA